MMVTVKDTWIETFQAKPQYDFKDDKGNPVSIPAQPARTVRVALCENENGYVLPVEVPDNYETAIEAGDKIDIESKAYMDILAMPIKAKHIKRHQKKSPSLKLGA